MAAGTWIKLHSNVFSHKKTFILAANLKINETYAAAHIIRLWTWAIDNTKDGCLQFVHRKLIAKAADWSKNADTFVDACIDAGWLDEDEDGNLSIHEWDEYTEALVRRREKDAARKRAERKKRSVRDDSPVNCPQDVRRTSTKTSAGCPQPKSRVEKSRVDSTTLGSTNSGGSSSIEQADSPAASASENPLQDKRIAKVVKAYERDIGMPSGTVMDKLVKLIVEDSLAPGLVTMAIAEAAECNKRSLRYVEGILNRCKTDGIVNETQFAAQKVERLASRPAKPAEAKSREPTVADYGWGQDDSKLPDFMKGGDSG